MLKKVLSLSILSLQIILSQGQDLRTRWVDSVFSALDRESRIGQLFMMPMSAGASPEEITRISELVRKGRIGSIYITGGGPQSHVRLLNKLQGQAAVPLLFGIAAEWGLAQTMDSTLGYQKPMLAASWKEDSLTRRWGTEIATQLKLLGFHINFAPNADDEIFAGDYLRYFGNEESTVAGLAVDFTHAMKDAGLLVVAKHLPRKIPAVTSIQDSTLVLNLERIDTAGLFAFYELIRHGIDGIQTNYLHFSVQNDRGIVPAALSQVFISEVLKKRMHFDGLVFTDVKEFQKKAGKVRDGEAELLAFETGNDVLMFPLHVEAAIKKISKRLKKNKLLEPQLSVTVKKILAAKYDAGLNHFQPVDADNLMRKLHSPESNLLKHQLAEASVTLVANKEEFLPIRTLEGKTFTCLSVGRSAENDFSHYLKKYAPFQSLSISSPADTARVAFADSDIIVVGVFPYAADLERQVNGWITRLAARHPVVVATFANPAGAESYLNATALIAGYTDQDYMPSVTAQMIFGALPSPGMMPIRTEHYARGHSMETAMTGRLSYTMPEAAGLDSRTLEKIKTIMKEAIDMGATPGCQVLVARDGKVVYEQSAGWLTYDNKVAVTDETIYDLASLTKVSATLQAVMFMQERGLIDINKKASAYLPELKESNKKDFLIKDILTHQAGLWPFLPFWAQTMADSVFMTNYYSTEASEDYPYPVAQDLFATRAMKDSLWQWIIKAKVRDKPARTPFDYRYSDMGFYILQHMAEKLLQQPMQDFLEQNLYGPLGAYTTGYLPLRKFSSWPIAPTEDDKLFRKKLLTGYVHDQGAAMHGGVAGHAGLFSTANDLAKLGQLWLQKGAYGGYTYYKPGTIELFTARQFEDSRRGLGWDKPPPSDWTGPTSLYASPGTFGHTGFTGTCIWVDPEFNLVYIFFSNRVHPDMNNNKLLNAGIRPRVQDVVYEAIFNYCSTHN